MLFSMVRLSVLTIWFSPEKLLRALIPVGFPSGLEPVTAPGRISVGGNSLKEKRFSIDSSVALNR